VDGDAITAACSSNATVLAERFNVGGIITRRDGGYSARAR